MTEWEIHLALCLIQAGRSRDVSVSHRLWLVSNRMAVADNASTLAVSITDKGKDKIRRKGR